MPPCRTNLSCFKETCLASPGQIQNYSTPGVCVTIIPSADGPVRKNFEYSLLSGMWGSKKYRNSTYGTIPQKDDILLVGDRCWKPASTPRGYSWLRRDSKDDFDSFTFQSLLFFRILESPHKGDFPHWEDEKKAGDVIYDFRFEIEPLRRVENIPAADIPVSLKEPFAAMLSRSSIPVRKTLDTDEREQLGYIAGAKSWYDLTRLHQGTAVDCSLPRGDRPIYFDTTNTGDHSGSSNAGSRSSTGHQTKEGQKNRKKQAARQHDTLKRLATEQYAVDRAEEYYKSHGWQVEIHGAPFDLLCTRDGDELRVEVKGTTTEADDVVITRNERLNARDHRTDLFVVHSIELEPVPGDIELRTDKFGATFDCQVYVGTAGIQKVIHNWVPDDGDLDPAQYDYTVPKHLWEDPVHGDTAL